VESQRTKEPLSKSNCEWIFKQCLQRGLLTMAYAPRVRINPPLLITEEQAQQGAAILDEVFAALQQKGGFER
jgi:4-aminobutyrate aminotransferase / (S)-3-amino-2-methylpropionate transaminase / 5-aminovalerate transaminase